MAMLYLNQSIVQTGKLMWGSVCTTWLQLKTTLKHVLNFSIDFNADLHMCLKGPIDIITPILVDLKDLQDFLVYLSSQHSCEVGIIPILKVGTRSPERLLLAHAHKKSTAEQGIEPGSVRA